MPKRSNEFQQLVYLLKDKYSSEDTAVTESKMFEDPSSGTGREVDICIESEVAGHVVTISVECRDTKRPADVGWVEEMMGRHARLPTNALVLASRNGFTSGAEETARDNEIDLMRLDEVSVEAVSETFGELDSLSAGLFQLSPNEVRVYFEETDDLPEQMLKAAEHNYLHDEDGEIIGVVQDLVAPLLKQKGIFREIAERGGREHDYFVVEWDVAATEGVPDLYMKKLDPRVLQKIKKVQVRGECEIRIAEFSLRQGRLGDTEVVWGHTDFIGGDATLLTSPEDEEEKFHLRVVDADEWPPSSEEE